MSKRSPEMAETPTSPPASLPTQHGPMSFATVLDLAGPGPVPEPQQCRSCDRPNTNTKLLDCSHSVCGDCMTAAFAAGPSTDCPTCLLPSRTKDRIPDYVVEHFLAVSDRGRTAHVCAVHGNREQDVTPEPATFYCGTCSVFMCSVCSAGHRQDTSFHTHTPVLLEDLTPEMVRVPVTCPSHGKDMRISGFCTTCHVGVCPTCITGDHHTHTIVTDGLDTSVYAEVCRTLEEELACPVPPSKLDGVATTLRTLDELLAGGTANVKAQYVVIDEWARDGTNAVRGRAEVLRAEVAAKWGVRRKALSTQRRDVAQRVHAFAQARNYTTALCRIGAPREVLMASTFVKRRLSALRSWLRPIQPCVSRDPITVTLDAMTDGGEVTTHGHVSEPSVWAWQQGHPPRTGGGHCIYVVGGRGTGNQWLSTVQRYEPRVDAWEEVEAMPTPRAWLACAVLDNRLYAIGGSHGSGSMMVVESYDSVSRTWNQTCAAMDMARTRHACVTLGDHIYALGGGSSEGMDSVERYDARTNHWESCATMYECLFGRDCAVFDDHIYATGGMSHDLVPIRTAQRYDPMRDCWEPVLDMPVGRMLHVAVVLNDHLYVIGGRIVSGEGCSSRVDRFDPTRNEWESVAPLAVRRERLTAVTAGGRIYVMGGSSSENAAVTDVEAYDAATNVWTPCTPMPSALRGFGVGVLTVDEP